MCFLYLYCKFIRCTVKPHKQKKRRLNSFLQLTILIKNAWNYRFLHICFFELMGNKIISSEQSRTANILLFPFTILCTKRVIQLQNHNERFQSLLNAHTTMETKCIDPTHIDTKRHSSLNFSF